MPFQFASFSMYIGVTVVVKCVHGIVAEGLGPQLPHTASPAIPTATTAARPLFKSMTGVGAAPTIM